MLMLMLMTMRELQAPTAWFETLVQNLRYAAADDGSNIDANAVVGVISQSKSLVLFVALLYLSLSVPRVAICKKPTPFHC